MASIAKDRGLEKWAPDIIPVQLAASIKVFYGTIVAINMDGLGVPGSESLGLTFGDSPQLQCSASPSSVDCVQRAHQLFSLHCLFRCK